MLTFWWVRHAPVVGNNECCYGNNEVDCDVSNKESFNALSNNLPHTGIVFTSGLSRATKTFNKVSLLKKIPKLIKVDKRLEEQNLGDWTGLKYDYLTQITKEKKEHSET